MSNEGFRKWICPYCKTYTKRGGSWHPIKAIPRCPKCSKNMIEKPHHFEVPPKKDKKAWNDLKPKDTL